MDLFERVAALRRDRQPFVLATLVARRAPVSGHLGDRAIVFADGRMHGFIGGACSREIIRRQALEALASGVGRLVSIEPDLARAAASTPEHVVVPMTCVSEGAIDVYVEPFLPPRRLLIVGATPVASAVARLAHAMDYDVVRVVDGREQRDVGEEMPLSGVPVRSLDQLGALLGEGLARGQAQAVVVASQGHYDEEALEASLRRGAGYVGLVASRKRASVVRATLEANGVERLDTIRNPAGLDLGARTPPEVAVAILAEIVREHPSAVRADSTATAGATVAPNVVETRSAEARDPVCGMTVDVATARHAAEVEGVMYYFCCAGCRTRFLATPQRYGVHA